jgi:hypothetical protein
VVQTLVTLTLGTSDLANKAIAIDSRALNTGGDEYRGALTINSSGSVIQAAGSVNNGICLGHNFNTTSAVQWRAINIENNASTSGINTGIVIVQKSTANTVSNAGYGAGLAIIQTGAGTSIQVYGNNSVNSSTNGLVNYTLSNTQSGATVMQQIDTGTSEQGHTGLLINAANASTSVK